MAFRRRRSSVLEKMDARISALKNINPDLNLGEDINIKSLETYANKLRDLLDSYNDKLAEADVIRNNLDIYEKNMRKISERIFLSVAAVYGRDSNEYEMIGGKRRKSTKNLKLVDMKNSDDDTGT